MKNRGNVSWLSFLKSRSSGGEWDQKLTCDHAFFSVKKPSLPTRRGRFEIYDRVKAWALMSKEQSWRAGKRSQESVQTWDLIDSNMAPVAEQKKEKETASDKKEETKSKDETKKEEEKEMVTAWFASCVIVFVDILGRTKESRKPTWLNNFLELWQRQLSRLILLWISTEWGGQTIARGVDNACWKIVGKSLWIPKF